MPEKPAPKEQPGPKPDTLKLEGSGVDAMRKSLAVKPAKKKGKK